MSTIFFMFDLLETRPEHLFECFVHVEEQKGSLLRVHRGGYLPAMPPEKTEGPEPVAYLWIDMAGVLQGGHKKGFVLK